ncbi:flavodoxin family protein [Aquimarina rhabdastrellae]
MKRLIIQGSSRSNGNTHKVVELFRKELPADIVDLNDYKIGHFDYDFKNTNDDFLPLFEKIIDNYDMIIFATPVYWYSMSGHMKVFFDRITDFLKIKKDKGRLLRGKYFGTISCGSEDLPVEGFFIPFRNSADYLGMNYIGDVHVGVEEEITTYIENKIKGFTEKIKDEEIIKA